MSVKILANLLWEVIMGSLMGFKKHFYTWQKYALAEATSSPEEIKLLAENLKKEGVIDKNIVRELVPLTTDQTHESVYIAVASSFLNMDKEIGINTKPDAAKETVKRFQLRVGAVPRSKKPDGIIGPVTFGVVAYLNVHTKNNFAINEEVFVPHPQAPPSEYPRGSDVVAADEADPASEEYPVPYDDNTTKLVNIGLDFKQYLEALPGKRHHIIYKMLVRAARENDILLLKTSLTPPAKPDIDDNGIKSEEFGFVPMKGGGSLSADGIRKYAQDIGVHEDIIIMTLAVYSEAGTRGEREERAILDTIINRVAVGRGYVSPANKGGKHPADSAMGVILNRTSRTGNQTGSKRPYASLRIPPNLKLAIAITKMYLKKRLQEGDVTSGGTFFFHRKAQQYLHDHDNYWKEFVKLTNDINRPEIVLSLKSYRDWVSKAKGTTWTRNRSPNGKNRHPDEVKERWLKRNVETTPDDLKKTGNVEIFKSRSLEPGTIEVAARNYIKRILSVN